MPIGRHWKQLRPYDDCFVASEAVDWLFEVLQHRHDSSPKLTRYYYTHHILLYIIVLKSSQG